MREFFVTAGPATTWKVRVVIWPTRRALVAEHKKYSEDACEAFCLPKDPRDRKVYKSGVIAEIHFHRKGMQVEVIAHESVHAALAWVNPAGLDLFSNTGEELFAEAVEWLVKKVVARRNR
jgi:hypothetical protein